MKRERHRRTPNNYIWSRILERYRGRRDLFRPRVPLVLRRHGVLPISGSSKKNGRPNVSHYQFALHLHLSSLSWASGSAGQYALQASNRLLTLLQILLKQAGQADARPLRLSGLARRDHAAIRSLSEPPFWQGRSADGLSSHTASSPGLPSSATRVSSNDTSVLMSVPRQVSLKRSASPFFRHARSRMARGSEIPDVIPDRRTRHASTRSVFATGLVQRRLQRRVERFDASQEVVRFGPEVVGRSEAMKGAGSNERTWAHLARLSTQTGNNDIGDPHGPPWSRSSPTSAVRRAVSAPFHPLLMTALQTSQRQVEQTGERRPRVAAGMRFPLYSQPAARNFANRPAVTAAQQTTTPEQRSALLPPSQAQAPQPQIDLERLSEDVYQHIQRRIRIERERRGL